jgi:hypothetical protein
VWGLAHLWPTASAQSPLHVWSVWITAPFAMRYIIQRTSGCAIHVQAGMNERAQANTNHSERGSLQELAAQIIIPLTLLSPVSEGVPEDILDCEPSSQHKWH